MWLILIWPLLFSCLILTKIPSTNGKIITFDHFISLYNKKIPVRQSGFMQYLAVNYALDTINKADNNSLLYLFGDQVELQKLVLIDVADKTPVETLSIGIWPCHDCDFSDPDIFFSSVLSTYLENVKYLLHVTGSPIVNFLPQSNRMANFESTFYSYVDEQIYSLSNLPNDDTHNHVLYEFIKNLHWTYFDVMYSNNFNIELLEAEFMVDFQDEACINSEFRIGTRENLIKHLQHVDAIQDLHTIILFTNDHDSRMVLETIKHLNMTYRFIMLFAFGNPRIIDVVSGLESAAHGVLSVDLHYNDTNKEFERFVVNQTPANNTDPHFLVYYEEIFQCQLENFTIPSSVPRQSFLKNCSQPYKKFSYGKGLYKSMYADMTIRSIFKFFEIYSEIKYHFESLSVKEIDETLANMTIFQKYKQFFFDEFEKTKNVSYSLYQTVQNKEQLDNVVIGEWYGKEDHTHKIHVNTSKLNYSRPKTLAHGQCSVPCGAGSVTENESRISQTRNKCCWRCLPCPKNTIVLNNTCHICSYTHRADLKRNTCIALPMMYELVDMRWLWLLVIFSVCGIFAVVSLLVMFRLNIDKEIVRASGRELTTIILLSLLFLQLSPLAYLMRPSAESCVIRNISGPLCFVAMYSATFLKAWRVYRIFTSASRGPVTLSWTQPRAQMFFVMMAGLVQCIYMIVLYAKDGIPDPQIVLSHDNSHLIVQCETELNPPATLFQNTVLMKVIIVAAAVISFQARHFPVNYHEAWHVNITLFITITVWTNYYVVQVVFSKSFYRFYINIALYYTIAYITLLGFFMKRAKMLLLNNNNDTEDGTTINGSRNNASLE